MKLLGSYVSHLLFPVKRNEMLGWYQGRVEFGPRALGNRSILSDRPDPEMKAKVNNTVKFREWWRPFAPSFKKEAAPEYLESAYDSPFMILTAPVRPEKREVIPSVTHIDGSARPQTVEKEINPLYYRLIDEFGKHTGVPLILNTSFNLRGETIVHTPTDAIRTFFCSRIGCSVSWLVSRGKMNSQRMIAHQGRKDALRPHRDWMSATVAVS